MTPEIKKFATADEFSEVLASEFQRFTEELSITRKPINICLSGGSTPNILYRKLANFNRINERKIHWDYVHFYWGDERCVPPNHPESNFGNALKYLLKPLRIEPDNIHRMQGEHDPTEEAEHYGELLKANIPLANGFPRFDWTFLGLGEDGHTASIFPNNIDLLYDSNYCGVAEHPETKQKRITLTGKVLINSKRISFLVSGDKKSKVVADILQKTPESKNYPASFIKPVGGKLSWYLDNAAASAI